MNNKEIYEGFVKSEAVYIPVYSKPWWLDAVCGKDNWDVWLYMKGEEVIAAMPYYHEIRGEYQYITKTPVTQNNGLIFRYPDGTSYVRRQSIREEVINNACDYIESLGLDVYEQQYHYTFDNYLPFFWRGYKAIPRYTYVIDTLGRSEESIWGDISSKRRSIIKKGQRNGCYSEDIGSDEFYKEHEKIFLKQGMQCPFSKELWDRLYNASVENESGKIVCYKNSEGCITSLSFIVWDDKSVYLIMGGGIPEYQNQDTYAALIWHSICFAHDHGRSFDFEGSMIKRISKSFSEYGGIPREYYRIRKVFNKKIALAEVEKEYS